MTKTRVPTQKRSIEKRQKIVKAGFDLSAKRATIKQILLKLLNTPVYQPGHYIATLRINGKSLQMAFQQHLDAISSELLQQLISYQRFLNCPHSLKSGWMSILIYTLNLTLHLSSCV